jgi:nitrate reductase gamma subunit
VPFFASALADVDGFMEIGIPALYISNILIVLGLSYLLIRRLFNPPVRYISLPADYFPLLLLLGIVLTGILMRHFSLFRVDLIKVKQVALGFIAFDTAAVPTGIGATFWVHLTFIITLLFYFPFSKLMHVNPWNPAVEVHEYDHWEHEFHDKIVACGLPLDKPADEEA